jgi:uncharacterized protein YjeT (DUF2065 family)
MEGLWLTAVGLVLGVEGRCRRSAGGLAMSMQRLASLRDGQLRFLGPGGRRRRAPPAAL